MKKRPVKKRQQQEIDVFIAHLNKIQELEKQF